MYKTAGAQWLPGTAGVKPRQDGRAAAGPLRQRPAAQAAASGNDKGGPAERGRPVPCGPGLQKSMSPPPGAAGAFSFSGFSAITASVVRNRPAMDAAFCRAERVTFAGSMIPVANMST